MELVARVHHGGGRCGGWREQSQGPSVNGYDARRDYGGGIDEKLVQVSVSKRVQAIGRTRELEMLCRSAQWSYPDVKTGLACCEVPCEAVSWWSEASCLSHAITSILRDMASDLYPPLLLLPPSHGSRDVELNRQPW